MTEDDPLSGMLNEWEAPAPSPAMDRRVLAGYRTRPRPSLWRRIWTARVSIPVPALAALLLLLVGIWWIQFRARPAPESLAGAYVTRVEAPGFRALQNGATRVVRAREVRQ